MNPPPVDSLDTPSPTSPSFRPAMRAVVAALLALILVVAAAAPHVHAHARGAAGDECALCTLRHTAPPPSALPDVVPTPTVEGEAACDAALPPVGGAPLGAIPGQSPPLPA
jgi:hypothetical protein